MNSKSPSEALGTVLNIHGFATFIVYLFGREAEAPPAKIGDEEFKGLLEEHRRHGA